jgi:drug/metabolite transporter (DMT)-like permease
MNASSRAWLQLHFCVVLWGFTAIFGKLISLKAVPLVWWRMAIVGGVLVLVPKFWAELRRMPPRLIAIYAGIGALVGLHWILFYASIKLSNASIGAMCMALAAVFTAFIEPTVMKRRIELRELLFGLAVVPGVVLVVGGTPEVMRFGIVIGVLSAMVLALFATLNKRFIGTSNAVAVTGLEMASGAILLTLLAPLLPGEVLVMPSQRDLLLLLALAVGCTLLPFALGLAALRHVSAFSTSLILNLEPVYAIALAIVLLGEQRELAWGFYAGAAIILIVVFVWPVISSAAADRRGHDTTGSA